MPGVQIFTFLVNYFCQERMLTRAKSIMGLMVHMGVEPNILTDNLWLVLTGY